MTEPDLSSLQHPKPTPAMWKVLSTACAEAGLSTVGTRLLHHYTNTVWLLPAHNAVARVMSSPVAHDRAQRGLAVCQWLNEQAFPATTPLPHEMIRHDARTAVTFWTYLPQPGRPPRDSAYLGDLLRRLHALPAPALDLPDWKALTSLELLLHDTSSPVSETDRSWLLDRIIQIRHELDELDWSLGYGLIHGDAWAGNLLWDTSTQHTVRLGDWDSVCWGPRELDLICTWHGAIRFGHGPAWSEAFAAAYGHDLTGWPGLPVALAMRDLVQLVGLLRRVPEQPKLAPALHQRLTDIKTGDTTNVWQAA